MCEVGWSLLWVQVPALPLFPVLLTLSGVSGGKGVWSGAEQIMLKPYMQHPAPLSGCWALVGPC